MRKLALVALAALSACAQAPLIEQPASLAWATQSWTVTSVWKMQENSPMPSPLGARINLGQMSTQTVDGRTCLRANVTMGEAPLTEILGGVATPDLMGRMVPSLTYQCLDQPLAVYARLKPDELVTRSGPWLVWLRPTRTVIQMPF